MADETLVPIPDLAHDCQTCHMQPGSDTTLTHGCSCAVWDNHRGHRPGGLYITQGCPVHWPTEAGEQR